MKLYIADPIHPDVLAFAKAQFEVVDWKANPTEGYQAEAVIVRTAPMKADDIKTYPNLKIISKHGAGTDNIDLSFAKENGILVTNTPGTNSNSVAELIVCLMLALSRNVVIADKRTRDGLEQWTQPELAGFELHGKTVGLIGLGQIGQRTAKIVQAGFGCRVLGYDPYLSEKSTNALMGIEVVNDLEELLKQSDYVSLSVPLTEQTHNLIDKKQLELMKKNSYLINTARGAVVNEIALAESLKQKKLAGAAFDVFAQEPPSPDNPLMQCDNFIATPHLGAATNEALIRMGQCAVEQVMMARDGKTPSYIVNI